MKHDSFYILLLGVLLLTACSEGEAGINEPAIANKPTGEQPAENIPLPIDETEHPIVFSASVEEDKANTRTLISEDHTVLYGLTDTDSDDHTDFHEGIETNADLQETGFGAYAFYTKDKRIGVDNFASLDESNKAIVMLNQEVEWDDTKWTYSPMRFWPGNQNYMSFFAYAPYNGTSFPSIGSEGTEYEKTPYFRFRSGQDIQIPKSSWTFANQQDLLWGARNNSVPPTGLDGMSFKNIKLSDTDNGTLHWRFRHALARVNFSLYFNFGDFYSSPAVPIPTGRVVHNSAKDSDEGTVGGNDNSPVVLPKYEDENNPELNGYYIKLNENGNSEALCHKYEELTESSLLVIITGVKFKNYVQSADLSYDNSVPWLPVWDNLSYDTSGFSVPSDLLNPNIYKAKDDIENLDVNTDWTTLPHWGQNTNEPLFVLPPGMEGKTHYTLFVPTTQCDLEVVISYKIVRAYKLTGYFHWLDGKPVPQPEMGAFTMTGITGHEREAPEKTTTATISITNEEGQTVGFEPNKSYSVSMHLGKLMRVLFEVTDWDVPESITINIPSFD